MQNNLNNSNININEPFIILPSEFAQTQIKIHGQLFSFGSPFNEFRGYLKQIYDYPGGRNIVLVGGRQIEKSTTIASKLLINFELIPNFAQLYIAPRAVQSSVFSKSRFDVLRKSLYNGGIPLEIDQMAFKRSSIGSEIYFRSAYLNADSVRGISADAINVDEIQDILTDNLPVIEECCFHSDYKIKFYSGTQKTPECALNYYWELSTKNEWIIKCNACSKDNILNEKNISPTSLICSFCGKPIYMHDGQWIATGDPDAEFQGYRINQLMVPSVDLKEILNKMKRYSDAQILNEIFSLTAIAGLKPITPDQLYACCSPVMINGVKVSADRVALSIVAGVDWGEGDSKTVLTIGSMVGDKFYVYFYRKFDDRDTKRDPLKQVEEIAYWCNQYNVKLVLCDLGGGFAQTKLLSEKLPRKVLGVRYPGSITGILRWDKETNSYIANRERTLDILFLRIRKTGFVFPKLEDFRPYARDILNVYIEHSSDGRRTYYDHPPGPGNEDDALHSLNYCLLADAVLNNRPEYLKVTD